MGGATPTSSTWAGLYQSHSPPSINNLYGEVVM